MWRASYNAGCVVTQPVPVCASNPSVEQPMWVPTNSPSSGQFSGCATVAQVALKLEVVATRLLASFLSALAAKRPGPQEVLVGSVGQAGR